MLDGRVKTLHPKIHSGILFKRNKKIHRKQMQEKKFEPIDLVIVNFYPFETVIKKTSNKERKFVIVLGNFYSFESANLLKKRVKMESQSLRDKKITILKKNKHNFEVFLGPYKTIKTIKNDYIALKQINFDEVDIKIHD